MSETRGTWQPQSDRPPAEAGRASVLRSWLDAVPGAALMIGVAALVTLMFIASGLDLAFGVLGFTALSITAVLSTRRHQRPLEGGSAAAANNRSVWISCLSSVAQTLPDPALVLDRRGSILFFNDRARHLLELTQTNQPVSFALRVPEVIEAIDEAATTGGAVSVHYYQRVPTDRWFEAHVAPIRPEGAEEGPPRAILLVLRDLTQAQRLERMRADFVANASHELRTPLAAIAGFIETLQGPARDDAAARERFLGIMHSQAVRMSRLIDDLLSLSRIELSAHVRPSTVVDLREIAGHVVDSLSPLAAESGVVLTFDAEPQAICVLGDRDELIRACENLIENAIKYGATGGRVEVEAALVELNGAREGNLRVRDYGPGIAPEHLPRLTERFYRVDVAESRDKGGTGLGLAIVKHIANRHRGRLEIESSPGKGASFVLRFPAAGP